MVRTGNAATAGAANGTYSAGVMTLGGRFLAGGVRVADVLHLRWAVRRSLSLLPPPVRLQLGKLQLRLGYMQGLTLVPEAELEKADGAALRAAGLGQGADGAGSSYLEFGVFVGTSMACMYRAAERAGATGLRFVGFDSFQGMPKGVEQVDDGRWHPGELYSDIDLTRQNLNRLGIPVDRIELVPGWFEATLTPEHRAKLGLERVSVVMMDCVLSSSTRLALDFIEPLIRDRTVIIFDDWNALDLADRGLGERAAFEAWLHEHPDLRAEPIRALHYQHDSEGFLVTRVAAVDGAQPTEPRPN